MSKSLRLTAAALLLMLLAACSCSEDEYYERLDQSAANPSYSQLVSQTDVTASAPADSSWSAAAPTFKTGRYSMVSANSTEQTLNGTDGSAYTRSDQEYDYDLDITAGADGSIRCVYTFTRITWMYVENDQSYTFDTNNPDAKDSDTAMYYDLIGKSFAVSVDPAMNVTGITGVSEIIAAYPDTAQLISEDNLLAIAKDIFYSLPNTFAYRTSWNLNQAGIDTTFTLMQHRDGEFAADIVGAELPLPPDSYDQSTGFTTKYSEIGRLSGTLRMNDTDRAVQSFSYRQTSRGQLVSANASYDFDVVVSSSCRITRKA